MTEQISAAADRSAEADLSQTADSSPADPSAETDLNSSPGAGRESSASASAEADFADVADAKDADGPEPSVGLGGESSSGARGESSSGARGESSSGARGESSSGARGESSSGARGESSPAGRESSAGARGESSPAGGESLAGARGESSAEDDRESSADGDRLSSAEDDDDLEDEGREAPKRKELSDADLFRQSEVAADYIEGLLDILDADGDIDELVSSGRPVVEVVGAKLQSLVGPRGATLEALQELTRLAIFKQTGEPSRLLLDVGGYREQRRKELGALARNAVEKVREHGEAVLLEPMSAFERKCVHDVVNASEGVASESEGVEPSRRIVVRPA